MAKFDVDVQLSGTDGNAFVIMGKVQRALKSAGANDLEIKEYCDQSMNGDYENLLRTAAEWVNVY